MRLSNYETRTKKNNPLFYDRLKKTSLNYFIYHVLQFSHKMMQCLKGIITSRARKILGGQSNKENNFLLPHFFRLCPMNCIHILNDLVRRRQFCSRFSQFSSSANIFSGFLHSKEFYGAERRPFAFGFAYHFKI